MTDLAEQRRQLFQAFNRRDWPLASVLAASLLECLPRDADAHFVAGLAETEQGRLGLALQHFRRAHSLDPGRSEFSANLARGLSLSGARHEARVMADLSRESEPVSPTTLSILGSVYATLNANEASLEAFRRAATLAPTQASYRYSLATSLIDAGVFDEAVRELDACLSFNPHFWRAYLTRAHLGRQTPSTHHLVQLQTLLAQQPPGTEARAVLHLAMAKEYEDLDNYAAAFDHLIEGKRAARQAINYSIKHDQSMFSALERATPNLAGGRGHPSKEPIFVFGMPRTGTTLVERILSSHPEVWSAGELPDFGIALREVWGRDRPLGEGTVGIGSMDEIDWHRAGEIYLSRARSAARVPDIEARFIDKLPHNFLYAGFIAKTFPSAKLICLRRNPVDTCLANFRQLFSGKLPYYNYSFDLLDTGAYYILFDHLMSHWKMTFPGRILEVSYEALVDQQQSVTRKLLEFCELEWSESCLDFQSNVLPVSTASAIQVRSGIYQDAVQRWHKYRPQLKGLCLLLEQAGIAID